MSKTPVCVLGDLSEFASTLQSKNPHAGAVFISNASVGC